MNESVASSGGCKDNLDEGREASELATLNEGRGTKDQGIMLEGHGDQGQRLGCRCFLGDICGVHYFCVDVCYCRVGNFLGAV